MTDLVLLRRGGAGICWLTLNRPESRNALSRALVAELSARVAELAADRDVRTVIVTGAGDRAFCAGADLIERQTMTADERTAHTDAIRAAIDAVAALPVPVIAMIRGYALAGGTELALACDLRIGAESAVMGLPEVKIGIFPGAGGVIRLPRVVGDAAARDLLYTGRSIDALEAQRIGLLDSVQPDDALDAFVAGRAAAIAESAPLAVRALKRALRDSTGLTPDQAQVIVGRERRSLDGTEDYAEGLRAFAEKRSPRFTGR